MSEDDFEQKLNRYLARIEGHGVLKIDFDARQARLEVSEGERMFEGMVIGQKYDQAPWITSRICGVCPIAHTLAAIKAVEKAADFTPTLTMVRLRELLLCGQIIGSHILHLFFLVLPDYLHVKGATELARLYPAEFHLALSIKRFCDKVTEVIGGRTIHPVRAVAGGFTKVPTKEELSDISLALEESFDEAKDLAHFFTCLEYPDFEVLETLLSLVSEKDYAFYDGDICVSGGEKIVPQLLEEKVHEEVRDYSAAKFSFLGDKSYFTGALARLILSADKLYPGAHELYEKYFLEKKLRNPFCNNLAQAVEIVHFYEKAAGLVTWLTEDADLESALVQRLDVQGYRGGWGVGCVEAPRGLLYHRVRLDEKFLIKEYNIITPTSQNIANLEVTCQQLLEEFRDRSNQEKQNLVEMLIRAYDPCLTCSVH